MKSKKINTFIIFLMIFSYVIAAIGQYIWLIDIDNGQYQLCAYFLKGYNPYLLIGKEAVIDSIGKIKTG